MEIDVDERRRVSLGKLLGDDVTRLRVETLPTGELLLTPVVSLSIRELSVLADPARLASIKAGIDEVAEGKVRRYEPGHFGALTTES